MQSKIGTLAVTTFSFVMLLAVGGCSQEEPAVGANGQAIEEASSALTIGSMKWANGTYGAGCVTRSGSWSLRVSGSDTMDNPALSVVKNNTACVLTLTELVADATYIGTPAITLAASLAGSASVFAESEGPLAFYANAVLSSATFAADFTVTILYSDSPNLKTGSVTSGYAAVSATSTQTGVNAPDYTIGLGSLAVQVDVNYIVQSATGTANLTDGTYTGNTYFVDQGTLGASPTFAELDSAYSAATPTAISGSNPTVAASAFGLGAVNLTSTVYRTIVIRRLVSTVPSYETFRIAFSHP